MADSLSLSPTTTLQEDIVTAGQRRINLIWEATQSAIAVIITGATVYNAVRGVSSTELTNAFFLIAGFYFSRTNHAAIGGIGRQPATPYLGR